MPFMGQQADPRGYHYDWLGYQAQAAMARCALMARADVGPAERLVSIISPSPFHIPALAKFKPCAARGDYLQLQLSHVGHSWGGGGVGRGVRASIWWAPAASPLPAVPPPSKSPSQAGTRGGRGDPQLFAFQLLPEHVRGEMTIRGTTNEAAGPWGGDMCGNLRLERK